jgi:hypothetical protein
MYHDNIIFYIAEIIDLFKCNTRDDQWRSKLDNGGGGNIHIFVFTDLKNN